MIRLSVNIAHELYLFLGLIKYSIDLFLTTDMVQWIHSVYLRWKRLNLSKIFLHFLSDTPKETINTERTTDITHSIQYKKPWNKQSWLTLQAVFFFRQRLHWILNSAFNGIVESHLKFSAGVADLIDVRQRASVVRRPCLRQTKLLDLLKLHLSVERGEKNKDTTVRNNTFCTCGGNIAAGWKSQSSSVIRNKRRDQRHRFTSSNCFFPPLSVLLKIQSKFLIASLFFLKHVQQTVDVGFTCCKVVSLHKQLL